MVQDGETLLDISSLGHGHNLAVIADIEDTVLLEDWPEHVLHNNRRTRVADEARLLIELLGEEVYTEVAVLASLSRGRDADDLAWAALQHDDVTNADEMARDGDRVRQFAVVVGIHGAALGHAWCTNLDVAVSNVDVFFTLNYAVSVVGAFGVVVGVMVVVMMMAASVDWVQDAVGSTMQSVAERMVLAFVVVISHVTAVLVFLRSVECTLFGYLDFLVKVDWFTLGVASGCKLSWLSALVLPTTRSTVLLGEWNGTVSVVSLSYVDAGVKVDLCSWSVMGRIFTIPGAVLDLDLGVCVTLIRLTVSVAEPMMLVTTPWM